MITRKKIHELMDSAAPEVSLAAVLREPVVAGPDEPLRVVVSRMAETGLTRLPVVDCESRQLLGMISLHDLLTARVRNLKKRNGIGSRCCG